MKPTLAQDRIESPMRRQLLRQGALAAFAGAAGASWVTRATAAGAPAAKAGAEPPVFLQGHYRPVLEGTTARPLRVRGSVPAALSGMHLRNGHNPRPGVTPHFWFEGSGMVHGVRLHGGRAEWYGNRWVDTPALHGAPLFRADRSIDFAASAAGTNVVAHAGRILALQEVNLPYEIDAELNTVDVHSFGGRLKSNMTAHPKVDPQTGELIFFGALRVKPHLAYHVADRQGRLVHSDVIEGAGPSVMHYFAVSRRHVVFFDTSVVFNPKSGLPFPYAWDSAYPSKIGVMRRDRSQGAVKWIGVDPYYVFHLSNAWDDDQGRVIVEGTFWDQNAWEHTSRWINNLPGHGQGHGARRAVGRLSGHQSCPCSAGPSLQLLRGVPGWRTSGPRAGALRHEDRGAPGQGTRRGPDAQRAQLCGRSSRRRRGRRLAAVFRQRPAARQKRTAHP